MSLDRKEIEDSWQLGGEYQLTFLRFETSTFCHVTAASPDIVTLASPPSQLWKSLSCDQSLME